MTVFSYIPPPLPPTSPSLLLFFLFNFAHVLSPTHFSPPSSFSCFSSLSSFSVSRPHSCYIFFFFSLLFSIFSPSSENFCVVCFLASEEQSISVQIKVSYVLPYIYFSKYSKMDISTHIFIDRYNKIYTCTHIC